MGTSLRETTFDVAPAQAVALDGPLLEPRAPVRLGRREAALVAAAGRFGAVWLPAYALLVGRGSTLSVAIAVATVLAAVWTAALTRSLGNARLTLFALGPAPAVALGSAGGFVAASALALWCGLGIGTLRTFELAAAVFVFSAGWESIVWRSLAARRRVLVVGAGGGGAELLEELGRRADDSPFEPVGLVEDGIHGELAGVPVHGALEDLAEIVELQRPDIVVLAVGADRSKALDRLLEAAGLGFKVVGLPEFHEHAFGRVPVATIAPAWFMSVLHLYQRPYTQLAKRAFDVVVAALGLPVAVLALAPPWLASRYTQRGIDTASASDLARAHRLDPLSTAPLLAAARIEPLPGAIPELREAARQEPRAVANRYVLGVAYLQAGAREAARRELDAALRLKPGGPWIERALRQAR